jgi:hypothetical protein
MGKERMKMSFLEAVGQKRLRGGRSGWFALLLAIAACLTAFAAPNAGAAFGIAKWDGVIEGKDGGAYTQAGGHPFQIDTTVDFNSHPVVGQFGPTTHADEPIKDILAELPPGLMGNPTPFSQCTAGQLATAGQLGFVENSTPLNEICPIDSIIGITYVKEGAFTITLPIYNMVPPTGVPARFGFNVLNVLISVDSAVREDGEFHLGIDSKNIPQGLPLTGARLVFWGSPYDTAHDGDRCWTPSGGLVPNEVNESPVCEDQSGVSSPHAIFAKRKAFLTMPTRCTAADEGLPFDVAIDSWDHPGVFDMAGFLTHEQAPTEAIERGTENCGIVPSNPDIATTPTVKSAETPSGLDVELEVPTDGLLSGEGISQSQLKKVEVTLPEGMSVNPSQAEGLGVCSPGQYAAETAQGAPGSGCPSTSKIGTVQIDTPLLPTPLPGNLYVAEQNNNPFNSLLAIYWVAKDPQTGVMIKAAGEVKPDPKTGQLTTTFDNLPQAPFEKFTLHFREGQRSPLSTPAACGAYETVARFTPWANPDQVITKTASFEVTKGVHEGPCPTGGLPPFKPGLIAGSINNAAGHYSPFNVRLTREDGEQEFTNFSIKLPPGISGKLAGIPFCSDAAIAAAKARTGPHGGQEELTSPSCPAASEVGRTLVGAGVGGVQAYAPGKIYLAGPYNGSALSIAAITAAKVGPFDLGTVVVRFALKIDPETAEVFIDATGSDPIPHIIQGIPTHIRDIRAYNDRPQFALNPTNCSRTSTASTLLGSGLDFGSAIDDRPVTVSTPYQAANCANLAFKPKLAIKLKGGTKRGGHPSLKATLKMKGGEANIARAQVTLPKSEFLDQSHIGTVCTRVQYVKDQCPAKSVYGYAKAITPLLDEPLQGPVYLRSSEHKLPDLVAGLKSGKIEIDLAGRIDSVDGQIRTTFESVPDAPVSTFTLTMAGGRKSLLENSTNLCARPHKALVEFDGQNGKIKDSTPVVKPQCQGKKKSKAAKRRNAR